MNLDLDRWGPWIMFLIGFCAATFLFAPWIFG